MSTFLRYLMAFMVQLAWQRTGKKSAVPPMRIPFGKNKDKSLPLPIIGPWQMMIAMWVARQIWTVYGDGVKTKLRRAKHPLVKHIGSLLPDTGISPAPNAAVQQPATPTPAPRPAPQYDTRPLDTATNGAASGSGNLPPGSLLNSLRSLN